jgi:hypothetical protein
VHVVSFKNNFRKKNLFGFGVGVWKERSCSGMIHLTWSDDIIGNSSQSFSELNIDTS